MANKKKKKKSGQFPSGSPKSVAAQDVVPAKTESNPDRSKFVRPEHISLAAHDHIVAYLNKYDRKPQQLSDGEMVAILQLSQHLRVFGLLSAAGFVKQANQQSGATKEKRRPVWELLLCKLLDDPEVVDADTLKTTMVEMAKKHPAEYLALWRRAILLSKHWNFWGRAYQEKKVDKTAQEASV